MWVESGNKLPCSDYIRVIIYSGRAVMIVVIVVTGLVSDSAVLSGVSIYHQVTRRHFAIDTIAKGPDLSPKYSLG